MTPYQNYMWNGMIGLFLKMEQNNLYNEINFNLVHHRCPTTRRRSGGRSTASSARPTGGRRPSTTGTGSTTTSQLGPSDYRGNLAAGMHRPQRPMPTAAPTHAARNPYCLLLRQRHDVPELDGQHGRHHRRHVHDDPHRREHLAARRLVAGDELPSFGPTSTGPSTSRSLSQRRQLTGPTGRASTPARSISAYCDGSVRPVTSQINKLVLNKLMTRNGGETISSDEIK